MSKLTQVRTALEDNPGIAIVGAPECNHLPNRVSYWSHTVDFHVAPKTGGVYTAGELQALMMSLVPELEPNQKDDFWESDLAMQLGKLYFDEEIGTEVVRREIVLSDEDMFSSPGFVDGKCTIQRTERVQRRTWVRLFPNIQIATAALEGADGLSISKSRLSRYR